MNHIEHDILTRCLHMIYSQLLTHHADAALESMERLIYLIRHMETSTAQATLQEELQTVREVFLIYRTSELLPDFQVACTVPEPRPTVSRNTVVYELCQHGMELIHSGCRLLGVTLTQEEGQLTYVFTDAEGGTYKGTVCPGP